MSIDSVQLFVSPEAHFALGSTERELLVLPLLEPHEHDSVWLETRAMVSAEMRAVGRTLASPPLAWTEICAPWSALRSRPQPKKHPKRGSRGGAW